MKKTRVLDMVQKYTMILVLVLVVLFFYLRTGGKLLMPQNITNIISQNAYVFVLATGMLLCILTGGNIDLSVGSVVCFTGAIGALMLSKHLPMGLAIVAMLGVGLLIGAWQAFWIAYVRIPPFITTLSGMLVFRGLSNVILKGQTVSVTNKLFVRIFGGGNICYIGLKEKLNEAGKLVIDENSLQFAKTLCLIVGIIAAVAFVLLTLWSRINRMRKGYKVDSWVGYIIKTVLIAIVILFFGYKLSQYKGLPTVLIWVAIVIGIYSYITSKTTIGRHFYAVGGNEKATKLSGINTNRVYFLAYTNMGLLAGLAGMLTIARLTSAQPTYGQSYEMDAIGSCFIGGASAYGGIGTVPGVIVGALLMGVINIGMSIMGVDQNWQKVVKGLVLLAAVIFDVVTKKKNS